MIVVLRTAIAIVISVISVTSPAASTPETTRQTQKRDDRPDHSDAFKSSHWQCSIRGAGRNRPATETIDAKRRRVGTPRHTGTRMTPMYVRQRTAPPGDSVHHHALFRTVARGVSM